MLIFKSVTKKDMQGIGQIVPDKETGNMFEELCIPISAQIKALTLKNENLRQTRDLLLPKLISGQIDVSELEVGIEAA